MKQIVLTLPDGTEKTFAGSVTSHDVAKAIGDGLARASLAGKLNGKVVDLHHPLTESGRFEIVTKKSEDALALMRHSCAHVMADAVTRLFPGVKLGYGPPIEHGFYYDFDLAHRIGEEDLVKIAAKMKEIVQEKHPFRRKDLGHDEAAAWMRERGQDYKAQTVEDLRDQAISFYQHGQFVDLCRGPHLPDTGHIGFFQLQSVAGAYWKGDARNPMLQRIYGTAFFDRKELQAHLAFLREAKKRDHRRLGRELQLFTISPLVGSGLILWKPRGAILRQELENFLRGELSKQGYLPVYTPHIGRIALYEKSGHYPYFRDSQFAPIEMEGESYLLRPMNCPHHIQIYASEPRSYRDLPLRLAEFGTVYRYEQTGELMGMTRVRGLTQDDAHIFCTHDQVEEELMRTVQLVMHVFRVMQFHDYRVQVSLRAKDSEKYAGTPEIWNHAEDILRRVARDAKLPHHEVEGEAAFYGPKLDFHVRDCLGRVWQLGTVQLDFVLPERFALEYTGRDGRAHRPVMLHRAPFGSLERFTGILIEHFGGDFPLWLAPEQVRILPITDRQHAFAMELADTMKAAGIRVHADCRNEKIGYKIREAELRKVPYMVIIGGRELADRNITVRKRKEGDLGTQKIETFLHRVQSDIDGRA